MKIAAMVLLVGPLGAGLLAAPTHAGGGFVTKANSICEGYYKKLNAVEHGNPSTAPAIVSALKKSYPLSLAEYDTFKKLSPPAADAATYKQWLALTAREMTVGKQLIAAGTSDHARFAGLLSQALALDKQYDTLAAKMGLSVCAQPTSKTK